MKKIMIFIFLGLISCNQNRNKKEFKTESDSIKYSNYLKVIDISGTFSPFVVINVKNMNTNEIKEICTKTNFLQGALHKEYKTRNIEDLIKNKNRYFEFKDTSALNNIGFEQYSNKKFLKFKKDNKIDSLIDRIIKKQPMKIDLKTNEDILFYAHSLFNRGILTGENSCFGGVSIIDDAFLKSRKESIERIIKNNKK